MDIDRLHVTYGRRVALKELWTLKWHKTFNMRGPWMRAGGVQAAAYYRVSQVPRL